ncbi:MAG TPA: hypothetical protein VGS20_16180 [Candidatus Acidoferrales bacterium]|nr:hypothetical protein [Candidatus Acidoferrales bacterium]
MRIRKRLIAIAVSGGIGGLLLVPFALRTRPDLGPLEVWLSLPIGSFLVTALCAWGGLHLADRANLPMPFLRPWETGVAGDTSQRAWMLRVSVAAGGIFGLAAGTATHWLQAPAPATSWPVRMATIPFAAVVPETVVHLLVMSALVVALKRTWIPIVLSSLVYVVLFHGQWFGGTSPADFIWVINFALGMLTGWVYSRHGIESAFLTHAVAHAFILSLR